MRTLWNIAGFACVGLGAIGALLPLLPTVPFMLLATFCFARGSKRFHDWLVTHPRFGPPILNWQEHGTVSRRAKVMAGIAIAVTFSVSVLMEVRPTILVIQAIVLSCVCMFLFSRPERPKLNH